MFGMFVKRARPASLCRDGTPGQAPGGGGDPPAPHPPPGGDPPRQLWWRPG